VCRSLGRGDDAELQAMFRTGKTRKQFIPNPSEIKTVYCVIRCSVTGVINRDRLAAELSS